jgi:hypothetical protein
MLGKEWEEAPIWFAHFLKYCDESEYPSFQTCDFCHQCSRLCGRIQFLLKRGQPDEILANVPSILRDVEAVENNMPLLSNLETVIDSRLVYHHGRYCGGALILQTVFRMRVSYHLLAFLQRASHLSSYLGNQKDIYKDIQTRCIQEMHALAERILRLYSDQVSPPLAHENGTNLDHLTKSSATEREGQTEQSQSVRFEIDFDNLADGNSTLVVRYHHSGIVVTRLTFDCL